MNALNAGKVSIYLTQLFDKMHAVIAEHIKMVYWNIIDSEISSWWYWVIHIKCKQSAGKDIRYLREITFQRD